MRLRLHPEAIVESREARRWYFERDPAAASAFMAELDRAVAAIVEFPDAWPPFEAGTRRFLFKRFPYYAVYRRLEDDLIEVVAVMHARRRPGYWRSR